MATVNAYSNEDLEITIRRFSRKVNEEGIVKEFKDRRYYKKPSLKKHEQTKAAKRKMQKKLGKQSKDY